MRLFILEDNCDRIEFFKRVYVNHELFITRLIDTAYDEACRKEYDIFFLDHDLEQDNLAAIQYEETGYDFVKKLVESNLQKNAIFYIHSMNPTGANAMLNLLKQKGYEAQWIPFHLLKLEER